MSMEDRIVELIEEAEELRGAKERFDELSKMIRQLIDDEFTEGDTEIEDYIVSKTAYSTTRYDIPDKIKQKYAKKVDALRISWKQRKEIQA